MVNSGKRCTHAATATVPKREIREQEKAMLRDEFEVMQKLDFTFIKEIGASNAEEYIVKITSLEFLKRDSKEDN